MTFKTTIQLPSVTLNVRQDSKQLELQVVQRSTSPLPTIKDIPHAINIILPIRNYRIKYQVMPASRRNAIAYTQSQGWNATNLQNRSRMLEANIPDEALHDVLERYEATTYGFEYVLLVAGAHMHNTLVGERSTYYRMQRETIITMLNANFAPHIVLEVLTWCAQHLEPCDCDAFQGSARALSRIAAHRMPASLQEPAQELLSIAALYDIEVGKLVLWAYLRHTEMSLTYTATTNSTNKA